jgi:hypothetical protein
MPPKMQKAIRQTMIGIFGNDIFKYLVRGERVWQNVMGDARVTIVVKSGIVPLFNILSNIMHLLTVGVPITDIVRRVPRITAEVNTYTRNEVEKVELAALLFNAKAENNSREIRRLELKIQSIEDAHRRLSIWPLIEAGEFSSITEAGLNHDDLMLTDGKLMSFLEKKVDQLPESVRNAGRYAVISQDTALFQGLQKAVQYGDFVAKALLYQDLTERKKQSSAQALGQVTEEFGNFDRAAGRFRSYLENMGMLWFWRFKIRAMKVALRTIRNNPLQVFLTSLLPMPAALGSIGTPVSDNLLSVGLDGRLGYSIGADQAFHAYGLHPTWNLMT